MNILVGCEFSGVVRDAFITTGHNAISCDLLPTESVWSDGSHHHQGDIYEMLDRRWDMIIMHPDCTCVCNAGNRHYGEGKAMYYDRLSSAYWIKKLWIACRVRSKRVCFENPPGILPKMAGLPAPHYVQPWWFGHFEQKRTGLYLHGLPPLKPTDVVYDEMMELDRKDREAVFYMGPHEERWMDRSRTYKGIAKAMAEQWV